MSKISAFNKDSFQDYFDRVKYGYDQFNGNHSSHHEAENFCFRAHHFYEDWLKHLLPHSELVLAKQHAANNIAVELAILRDITDGLKHIELTKKPHKQLSSQGISKGAYSSAFSFGFNQPLLFVTLKDGSEIFMGGIIEKVFEYTEKYFASKLTPKEES